MEMDVKHVLSENNGRFRIPVGGQRFVPWHQYPKVRGKCSSIGVSIELWVLDDCGIKEEPFDMSSLSKERAVSTIDRIRKRTAEGRNVATEKASWRKWTKVI